MGKAVKRKSRKGKNKQIGKQVKSNPVKGKAMTWETIKEKNRFGRKIEWRKLLKRKTSKGESTKGETSEQENHLKGKPMMGKAIKMVNQ